MTTILLVIGGGTGVPPSWLRAKLQDGNHSMPRVRRPGNARRSCRKSNNPLVDDWRVFALQPPVVIADNPLPCG